MGCGPWGQKESDTTERLSTAQKVKRVENVFDEIMAGNSPNLEEEETYPGTGGPEGSKQDEPKETRAKIHHN